MLEIKENESLKNHTSFRIGGPARYFVAVKNEAELREALDFAQERAVAFKVIGGGSNILISDQGFDGLIIQYLTGAIEASGETMECPAGAVLAAAIQAALKNDLLGLEWGVGIPGTIGGAIHNNAGAYEGEMADAVSQVKVIREGKILALDRAACGFGYRDSVFKSESNRDIIVSATLQLRRGAAKEMEQARALMNKHLQDRLSKAAEGPSVGSTFRNILLSVEEIAAVKNGHPELPEQYVGWKKIPAAWLIEECGLKGRKIGGAMVSEKHAGKITNVGNATAEDVVMLISVIKQKVRSRFNLQLMEEVEYIGF